MTGGGVFVGGFRSGSTLLINLLGLHPDVAPWFETKCLVEALRWVRILASPQTLAMESALINPRDPAGFTLEAVAARMSWHGRFTADRIDGKVQSGKANHERYPIGADCVAYSLAEFDRALANWQSQIAKDGVRLETVARHTGGLIRELGALHAQRLGGGLWINKTPEIPRFAAELRQCLGKCKIVHLIRDGREVAVSAARLGWGPASEMARWWAGLIEDSRSAVRGHEEDYLEIRFEDLVADPIDQLSKILPFLGLSPDETLVGRYESLAGARIDLGTRALKASVCGEETELIREVNDAARPMLEQLGYLRAD